MAERQNQVWTIQRTEGGKAGARPLEWYMEERVKDRFID